MMPFLSKPILGEVLSLYLVVSDAVVSITLVREEEGRELHVFYISKALIDPKTNYPDTEKIALALVVQLGSCDPIFSHILSLCILIPLFARFCKISSVRED